MFINIFFVILSLSCSSLYSMQPDQVSPKAKEIYKLENLRQIDFTVQVKKDFKLLVSYSCGGFITELLDNGLPATVNKFLKKYNIQVDEEFESTDLTFAVNWSIKKLSINFNDYKDKLFDLSLPETYYQVELSKCAKYFILYCFIQPQESDATVLIIVPIENNLKRDLVATQEEHLE